MRVCPVYPQPAHPVASCQLAAERRELGDALLAYAGRRPLCTPMSEVPAALRGPN